MAPRRYRMESRRAASQQMRRKIVEATMHLHNEQGILATSWEDIARKADVAVATVYRYFPTINELVEGCGALVMETIRPPPPDAAPALFDGSASLDDRVGRLVNEFCAFYERAVKPFVAVLRDYDKVPRLRGFVEHHRGTLGTYVRAALAPFAHGPDDPAVVSALLDFPMWKSLIDHGLTPQQARDTLAALLRCRLNPQQTTPPRP